MNTYCLRYNEFHTANKTPKKQNQTFHLNYFVDKKALNYIDYIF